MGCILVTQNEASQQSVLDHVVAFVLWHGCSNEAIGLSSSMDEESAEADDLALRRDFRRSGKLDLQQVVSQEDRHRLLRHNVATNRLPYITLPEPVASVRKSCLGSSSKNVGDLSTPLRGKFPNPHRNTRRFVMISCPWLRWSVFSSCSRRPL